PYSTETAFPKWTGVCLAEATGREVEVINCGGLSYASYRVLAILREVKQYDPDLILIYTGHNEFLERRTLENARSEDQSFAQLAQKMYLVRWAAHFIGSNRENAPRRTPKSKTVLAAEVEALLDYQGGLEQYSRNDLWLQGVDEHFEWNVRQMLDEISGSNIPLVFVSPVSNLKDCPPFKFENDPSLSSELQSEFEKSFRLAIGSDDPRTARSAVEKALEIDPDHAGANFLFGKLAYEQHQFSDAEKYFIKARDTDVCPLRAQSELIGDLQVSLNQRRIPFLDAQKLFSEQTKGGYANGTANAIVGDEWLVDHIHPSVAGHQLLGEALASLVLEQGWFEIEKDNWKESIDAEFQRRIASLGEEYFLRAKQRLEGLQLWTQGRAKKIRESGPAE
ncbi:MAG: tetratricopeptide repeat protein, partial [Planctomycetota bacterium]